MSEVSLSITQDEKATIEVVEQKAELVEVSGASSLSELDILAVQDDVTVIEVVEQKAELVEVSGMPLVTGVSTETLHDHVMSTEPHPAYDDLPSLTLIFENGLI